MVIRGKPRGNGKQLANYLVIQSIKENDDIHILEVAGQLHADAEYLNQTMLSMSLTSELTKSDKGLYHAQINPAYSEDKSMTQKDWLEAADILGKELGLENQRRIIVLHEKKGRKHAHVVWERYDHKNNKMISDSFSRLAQDRARKEMERIFEHKKTPHRNKNRPELKEALTSIWTTTTTGTEFIETAYSSGYMIAQGVPDRPYMVVDEKGRTFDLVRQLKGVRTKDVRARLKGETLMQEKQAIDHMRNRYQNESNSGKSGKKETTVNPKFQEIVSDFAVNRNEQLYTDRVKSEKEYNQTKDMIFKSEQEFSKRKKIIAEQFTSNQFDSLKPSPHSEDNLKRDFSKNKDMHKKGNTEDADHQRRMNEIKELSERKKQKKERSRG